MKIERIHLLWPILLGMLSLSSCGIYSFTGASIPPGAKTVRIEYFPNKASLVTPLLAQMFNEKLKNQIVGQSGLSLSDQRSDMEFSGRIVHYNNQPTSIQANDQAALNRLTVQVEVTFVNHLDEKFNFQQTFSRYKDYDARLNFISVENQLIEEITDELVEDIYQKAFVNW